MLDVLLDEIKLEIEGLALDVVASLVAAPVQGQVEEKSPGNSQELDPVTGELVSTEYTGSAVQTRISLRQALQMEIESINGLLTSDAARATKLVRLWRRVEGLLRQPVQTTQAQASDVMMGQQFGQAQMQTGLGAGMMQGQMMSGQGMDLGMGSGFTPNAFEGMKLDF